MAAPFATPKQSSSLSLSLSLSLSKVMPSPSACLPLYTPTPSIIPNNSKQKSTSFHNSNSKKFYKRSIRCKASSSSSYSITEFDLYDLLGVNRSSDQSQIKMAYRSLQKRCHPDIAGGPGHDMAIVLNEAYAILSDPNSRLAYDQELAKTSEFRGYTGKPLYSVWMGSESEQRACFVDEVKCVGCLKCALLAEKTFAIESTYGRARVVAQWGDPEHKIQEAIEACPVDCISMVDRSDLAALEFLMSKQPRSRVRMTAGNTVGERVANVFDEVKRFQTKFRDSMYNNSQQDSKETDLQREARMTAIQAIRSITNWLYWQTPNAGSHTPHAYLSLTHIGRKSYDGPNINKVREAAEALKQARDDSKNTHQRSSTFEETDEYWVPSNIAPSPTTETKTDVKSSSSASKKIKKDALQEQEYNVRKNRRKFNPMRARVPMGMAVIATVIIRLQEGGEIVGYGLEEHIGGSLALEMVNSTWLPVILAGIPWYFIGMVLVGLVEAFQGKDT